MYTYKIKIFNKELTFNSKIKYTGTEIKDNLTILVKENEECKKGNEALNKLKNMFGME